MRWMLGVVAMAGIGACAPPIPYDSPGGVGGGSAYERERAARDAALAGDGRPDDAGMAGAPLDATGGVVSAGAASGASEAERIAADARAALDAAGDGSAGVGQWSGSDAPSAVLDTTGISQENDFDAVGEERSIEEDAARIARNRAQYETVRPEAIGERPEDLGPNIVDFALRTTHPVGTEMYGRMNFAAAARHERNCAGYPSPDQAQLDFLRSGGPERDRKALDPDGDGYACGWDPAPYRRARGD